MTALFAPCLVVGPRRAGRDYDLLAVSAGLDVAVEDLSLIKRHNFDVRPFVRPGRPVHAFFRLRATGGDVWLRATTSLNGESAGNPVWITKGLVLTPDILDAVGGRVLPMDSAWTEADPPTAGSVLAAYPIPADLGKVDPGTLDPQVRAWAARLGRGRLAIEAPGEAVETVLAAVLDAAPAWRRRNLGFLSAPPEAAGPEEAPMLAVFEAGAGRADPPGYSLIRLDQPDRAAPGDPRVSGAWDALLEAAARERFDLARGLDQIARGLPPASGDTTSETETLRRLDAFLDAQTSDEARFDALLDLVRATRAIPDEAARGETLRALLKAFEKRMKAAAQPGFWLRRYLDGIEPVIGADGPRLLPARLGIETGAAFSLDTACALRIAPAIAADLAEAAAVRLERGVATSAPALEVLLGAVLYRLDAAGAQAAPLRLGLALVEVLARRRGASAPLAAAFLERLIAVGRRDDLKRLRQSGVLGGLKAGDGAGPIAAALSSRLRAARAGDYRSPESMASALALWRLGKAWEAA
jgi:hypothetical protein